MSDYQEITSLIESALMHPEKGDVVVELAQRMRQLPQLRRVLDAARNEYEQLVSGIDTCFRELLGEPRHDEPASPAPERMTLAEARAWLRSSSYPVPIGRGSLERCDAMIALITSGGELDFDAFEPLDWSDAQKAPESPQDASEPPGDTEGAADASEPAESNQDSQCVIPEPVGVEEQPLLVIPVTTCPECAQPVERCDCVPY